MRSLARWGALPLVITPLGSWALGLGEIEPGSYLNQPLYAEIPLSATADELSALSVSMASNAEFVRRGLDRPGFLSSFTFDIVRNSAGQNVIRVTSTRSITEPFVTLVVEARLPGRTQFREYTVLLDPPLFLPDAASAEPVAPPVARESAESGAGTIDRPSATAPVVEPVPGPAPQFEPVREPTPAPVERVQEAPLVAAAGGEYTVQGGDTLWAIATRSRPSGVTMNQTMMSIYQANPDAFIGNINLLRRGAILRIPPASELGTISAADATAEVARQTAAWAAGSEPSPQLVLLPPSDEPSASIGADAAESDAALAEVESTEAPAGAEAPPQDQVRTREELAEQERLLELQSAELADLQNQLDASDETQAASLDDEGTPESETQGEATAAESDVEAALAAAGDDAALEVEPTQVFVDESEPAEETTAQARSRPAATPAEPSEPSMFASIIGFLTRPLVLILFGVLVVLAAAFAFLRRRQDSLEDVTGQWEALESEVEEEAQAGRFANTQARTEPSMTVVESSELESAAAEAIAAGDDPFSLDPGTVEISAPTEVDVEPDDFEDDFEPESVEIRDEAFAEHTLSNQTVINLDQADPIAEADFHMAYGLYDQAADLVSKALDTDPGNRELKLKLLEVYFVWGNKEHFLEQARSLHSEIGDGGSADWDKVVIMGKQICPDETLFSGAMSAAPEVDLELSSGESGSAGLDFMLEDSDDEVDFGLATIDDAEIELEREAESELEDDLKEGEGGLGGTELEGIDLDELAEADLDGLAAGNDDSETQESPAIAARDDEDAMLDIGEQTQAGLEAAFLNLDDDDDIGAQGAHAETAFDIGSDAALTESAFETEDPTTEARDSEDAHREAAELEEAPAVEVNEQVEGEEQADEAAELEDVQSVSLAKAASGGGDTIEHIRPAALGQTEMTTELDLEDLGLDVSDIKELPEDLGEPGTAQFSDLTVEQLSADLDGDEDDLLSATGVTEVLSDADLEQTGTLALDEGGAFDDGDVLDDDSLGIRTEVLEQTVSSYEAEATDGEDDLDLNLDDFSSALDGGATAEQPGLSGYGIDLDVGDDVLGDDEPTGTEDIGSLDPQTMTEVGTKLDLARAYIDMGDPEGAKSILEEVMTEGDSGQRSEAQALINALTA